MGMPQTSQWFANSKPNPRAQIRLFCFPYAGGGSQIFRAWPSGLPQTVEVLAAQLPGRGNRLNEPPLTDLRKMIEAISAGILTYLDRPFAFFGHSMGALIAFELARLLRRERAVQPVRLFISGRRAPQCPSTELILHDLPEAEFKEQLRRLNGTPQEVLEHPELMELMTPLLRADFSMVETYQYLHDAPLDCPINAFGGLQDVDVDRASLEAWRDQTTSTFKLHMMPGDHFFLHSTQSLLLRVIAHELHHDIANGRMSRTP